MNKNKFFGYLGFWFKSISSRVKEHYSLLETVLSDQSYQAQIIDHAGMRAGIRPSWHIEKGIVDRAKKAGFGKLIQDFPDLTPADFEKQLEKGEKLMTEKVHFVGSQKRLFEAIWRVKEACMFPENKFEPVSIQYAAFNQLNHSSSSGFPDFVRKGKILIELIFDCSLLILGCMDQVWYWPSVRGFRLQLREAFAEVSRKIRLMYPYPGVLILLEDIFIMPFVQHFINTDTFYVIGRNGERIGNRLKDTLELSLDIVSLDVSSFDQTVVNEAIIGAFYIIRSQLKLTRLQSIAFDRMVVYFCTSVMVSKDSVTGKLRVFIKYHGVPSGSGFTNMIDTLLHAIIFEYLEPGILAKQKCLICGDDNIFDATGIDVKKLFTGYKTHFNLEIDPVKTKRFKNSRRVFFLGFEWVNFERHISPRLAINQVIWHSSFLTELDPFEREISRAASVLLNGKNGTEIFKRMYPDVMKLLKQGKPVRWVYLPGYTPPSALEGMGKAFRKTNFDESLELHLEKGYLIR